MGKKAKGNRQQATGNRQQAEPTLKIAGLRGILA